MVTMLDSPGDSVPPDGVKLTPPRLLLADQFRLSCELPVSLTVAIQVQPPPPPVQFPPAQKPVGLTLRMADVEAKTTSLPGRSAAPIKMRQARLSSHLKGQPYRRAGVILSQSRRSRA